MRLLQNNVEIIEGRARIVNNQLVQVNENGKRVEIECDNILLSVGLRPIYLDVANSKELCITSDDLFFFKRTTKKIVGDRRGVYWD